MYKNSRRVLSFLLAIIISALAAFTGVNAAAATDSGNFVFSHGSDDILSQSAFGSTNPQVSRSKDTDSPFGEAIAITQVASGSAGWAQLSSRIDDSSFSLSNAKGVAFYVEIPADADLSNMDIAIAKKDWSSYYRVGRNKNTSTYIYATYENGVVNKETKTQNWLLENKLGFKGFVFVSLDQFTHLEGGTTKLTASNLDKSNWSVAFRIADYNNTFNKDFFIDEVGYYSDVDSYVKSCYEALDKKGNYVAFEGDASLVTKASLSGSQINIKSVETGHSLGSAVSISPAVTNGGGVGQIPLTVTDSDFDFRAAKGLAMYVEFPASATHAYVTIRLINKARNRFYALNFKNGYTTISTDGRKETSKIDMANKLSGFKGYLFVPFSSLTLGNYTYVDYSLLNGSDWNVEIGYASSNSSNLGATFLYDSVGYYSDEEEYIALAREKASDVKFCFTDDGYLFLESEKVTVEEIISAIGGTTYDYIGVYNKNGEQLSAESSIATGMEIKFIKGQLSQATYKIALKNDMNGDAIFDIRDFVRLKRMLSNQVDVDTAAVRALNKEAVTLGTYGTFKADGMTAFKKDILGISHKPIEISNKPFVAVENGVAQCKIIIDITSGSAQSAAYDLQERIYEMSGVRIPVVSDEFIFTVNPKMIVIGENKRTKELGIDIPSNWPENESFRIYSNENAVVLVGNDENKFTGTEFAVTYLMEMLGFGWYSVENYWHVVPSSDTVVIPSMSIIKTADFDSRRTPVYKKNYSLGKRWYLGGYGSEVEHKPQTFLAPSLYYPTYYDWYAYSKGTRNPSGKRFWQMCYSNKDLQKFVAEQCIDFFESNPDYVGISVGQEDGAGADANWCECASCKAYASNPTETIMRFANDIAELVAPEYPDKTFMFYAYYDTFDPPSTNIKPHPNVMVMFCRQGGLTKYLSYKDGFNYSPQYGFSNMYSGDAFEGWKNLGYKHMALYEWACPGTNVMYKDSYYLPCDVYIENARWLNLHGCDFIFMDQGPNTVYERANNFYDVRWTYWFLTSRSMFDSTETFEDIMRPACEKLFGAAGDAMYDFYNALNEPVGDCTSYSQSWYPPDLNGIYTTTHEANADKHMNQALNVATKIGGDVYTRVKNQYDIWQTTKSYI